MICKGSSIKDVRPLRVGDPDFVDGGRGLNLCVRPLFPYESCELFVVFAVCPNYFSELLRFKYSQRYLFVLKYSSSFEWSWTFEEARECNPLISNGVFFFLFFFSCGY